MTLINRAHQIVDADHLHDELLHLRHTFRKNGYTTIAITQAFRDYKNHRPLQYLYNRGKLSGSAHCPFNVVLPYLNVRDVAAWSYKSQGLRWVDYS